mmetsp:Transcript_17280/g.44323  ORF Transcript_17280/g.44323 Transcript_17280/m.44323 type:complete len:193 (+) Transcript_17280:245-823(+)|eukprot:jgi/Tetstr1/456088/TSEL_042857.t1
MANRRVVSLGSLALPLLLLCMVAAPVAECRIRFSNMLMDMPDRIRPVMAGGSGGMVSTMHFTHRSHSSTNVTETTLTQYDSGRNSTVTEECLQMNTDGVVCVESTDNGNTTETSVTSHEFVETPTEPLAESAGQKQQPEEGESPVAGAEPEQQNTDTEEVEEEEKGTKMSFQEVLRDHLGNLFQERVSIVLG